MNNLPQDLQKEILLRLDPKSFVMMRCTSKSMEHITKDPSFKSLYWSRTASSLLYIGVYGSNMACFHHVGEVRPSHSKGRSKCICFILGYCSSLILVYIHGCFCVANPLTKKYQFLDYCYLETKKNIGFAVDQIDKTTQRFKIVCITEVAVSNQGETMYGFLINAGNSWKISKTKITCLSSHLMRDMKPVYFQGSLCWFKSGGSIIGFNPETEKARLIPTKFDHQVGAKLLLSADDEYLTLISATEELIYLYALENILTDSKWILTRRIKNKPVHQIMLLCWCVEAFDGRHVLVSAKDEIEDAIYGYDVRANTWSVMGVVSKWGDAGCDLYQFKPSWSSVNGLHDQNNGSMLSLYARFRSHREISVKGIMELINGHFRI
ncbi:putative F-box/kelch-repeat protein [Raphanus sativus]|nr:putative F-box/kelch-repeat protein [Raphanus sativus]